MKNLASLEIFLEVGKKRNFSKAAENLGLTKSTVSRQIQFLERELKVTLIKRDPRHFSLTDEGSVLLKRAELILDQTKKAFNEVTNSQAELMGSIHITTTADLALIYLARPAAEFSIRHPEVDLNIDLSPRQADLKSEGIDLAIRPGDLKDSSLYARKLNEQQPGFFASPHYLARIGRPKNISDLIKHSIISTSKVMIEGKVFSPKIVANNMSLVKQLALGGAGIGVLGEHMVKAEKKEGTLVQILTHIVLPKVPIYLLFPHKNMPKRVSILAQEILDFRI